MGAFSPQLEVYNFTPPTRAEDPVIKSVRFSALKNVTAVPHRNDLENTEDLFWTADELRRFREEALCDIQDLAMAIKVSLDEAQFILQQPDSTRVAHLLRPVWPQIDRGQAPRFLKKEISLLEYHCQKDCLSCEGGCFLGIAMNW